MTADTSITSVLITGANAGLGKECARQMAKRKEVVRVVLGCRSEENAEAAKAELEEITDKAAKFEILLVDVSDLDSVAKAVESLVDPVDAIVMNAGGLGGKEPGKIEPSGVTTIVAVNLLGHVALFDGLLESKKLTKAAIYAGSEGARGVKSFGFPSTTLKEGGTVEEFVTLCDGSFYGDNKDGIAMYGGTKYVAALWVAAMARKYPDMRINTVSPGGTSGTEVFKDQPAVMKFLWNNVVFPIAVLMGSSHSVETGAKRYVDVLTDDGETYKSGVFYASDNPGATGALGDQSKLKEDFGNETYQDNANEALHKFIKG